MSSDKKSQEMNDDWMYKPILSGAFLFHPKYDKDIIDNVDITGYD